MASVARGDDPSQQQTDAWIAFVGQQLKLTSDQKASLVTYEALISEQRAQNSSITEDQFQALSFPQQLDFVADQLSRDAAKMRTRADAGRHFYELMTPEQRSAFDAIGRPTRGVGAEVAPNARPLPPGPPPNNFTSPSHTGPTWLVRPTEENVARVYPSEALRRRLSGQVTLKCTVDTEGYLFDCEVGQETPAGAGFGNAALEITAYMRMKPATSNGVPTTSPIEIPINFAIPARSH